MDIRLLTLSLLFISLYTSAQPTFDRSYAMNSELPDDVTAPITDLLRTEVQDFTFGPATRIKFKIIEEGSGLATTYYKIGDLPFMKSDGRQMVPHNLSDGLYSMKYYSVDNRGNQEQIREDKIYIDKKGPTIRAEFRSPPSSFKDGMPVFSNQVHLTIQVADEKVHVQKLTYKINEGPVTRSENTDYIDLSEAISSAKAEQIKVEVKAYDAFYNHSTEIIEFIKQ